MPRTTLARVLDRAAAAVVGHRLAAIGGVIVLAGVGATGIDRLRSDPSPASLVASYADHERAAATLRERFGADSSRLVVVVATADDVLEPGPLGYVHRLSRDLVADEDVSAVRSVTVTPVPTRTRGATAVGPTLDDLDDEESSFVPVRVHDALGAIVRAEPERFEGGVLELAERMADVVSEPLLGDGPVGPAESARVRRAIAEAPWLEGALISRDRTVAAVVLELAPSLGPDRDAAAVDRIVAFLASHPPPAGVRVDVGGLPVIHRSLIRGMASDRQVLLPVTLLVCAVLLYLSFRWAAGVVLPLLTVGMTVAMVLGGMALAGEPMTILNNVVPPLLIVIGISDSIHLVNRYRQELAAGGDRATAARRTFTTMSVACFLTSATTAVGLASLAVSDTDMLRRFGVLAALGVMLAYFVTVLFLPPALTLARPPRSAARRGGDALERGLARLTRALLRRRITALAVASLFLFACALGATRVRVDSALSDQLDTSDPAMRATRRMDEHLQGTRPLEIVLTSDRPGSLRDPDVLRAVDEAAQWAERQPGVLGVTTPTVPLRELWVLATGDAAMRDRPFVSREQVRAFETLSREADPDPLAAWLTPEGDALRMQVRLADVGARRSAALIEHLHARLRRGLAARPDLHLGMGGEAFVGSLAVESVVDDLTGSLLLAVVLIFAMLALLFRSLRLGLASIPPNALPLVATLAWMAIRDIPLDVATAITFSIGLGLAVDGTIHVLARFREERRAAASVEEALVASACGAGRAVIVSTVTLSLGFSTLLLSEIVPVRHFGELVAITVAGCLVATLVVLPPLVAVLLGYHPAPAERFPQPHPITERTGAHGSGR